jgi:uncharacterized protein
MEQLIGREKELRVLQSLKNRQRSDFVAVFGRRRVGKTFLIRKAFEGQFSFQLTGLAKEGLRGQLNNFHAALLREQKAGEEVPLAKTWFGAFQQLITHLEGLPEGRKIIFLDELPWMDTPQSGFISALEHFWNSWASARADILLVVCGSAASWIIHNLLMNTGGLYNRVTHRIKLEPFTLAECEAYFAVRGGAFNRYQLIQLYMVFGGIPFYLEQVDTGKSALQNINDLCFAPDGFMRAEFTYLFASLFKQSDRHLAIVEVLAQRSKGMTRSDLLKKSKLANGGNASKVLLELEESNFIRKYNAFGARDKNAIYQLTDFYTFFYLKFIRSSGTLDNYVWGADVPEFATWSGYAFEQVCLLHAPQLKQALRIGGVITQSSAWTGDDGTRKVQIDLVVDRRDGVINLCEIKFSTDTFTITKAYAAELREKVRLFKELTKTKKAIYLTMVTTYGLTRSPETGLIQNQLTMDALFEPL